MKISKAKQAKLDKDLLVAIHQSNRDWMCALLDEGANPNHISSAASDNEPRITIPGFTPLMYCTCAETARVILAEGVDVCAQTSRGMTALHAASSAEHAEVLLAAGADVHAVDLNGLTPLFQASSAEVVKELVAAGAGVNRRHPAGFAPLHVLDDDDVLMELLQQGALLDLRNEYGHGKTAAECILEHAPGGKAAARARAHLEMQDMEKRVAHAPPKKTGRL